MTTFVFLATRVERWLLRGHRRRTLRYDRTHRPPFTSGAVTTNHPTPRSSDDH